MSWGYSVNGSSGEKMVPEGAFLLRGLCWTDLWNYPGEKHRAGRAGLPKAGLSPSRSQGMPSGAQPSLARWSCAWEIHSEQGPWFRGARNPQKGVQGTPIILIPANQCWDPGAGF